MLFFLIIDFPIQLNVNTTKMWNYDDVNSDFIEYIGYFEVKSIAVQKCGIFIWLKLFHIHTDIFLCFPILIRCFPNKLCCPFESNPWFWGWSKHWVILLFFQHFVSSSLFLFDDYLANFLFEIVYIYVLNIFQCITIWLYHIHIIFLSYYKH